MRTRVTLENSIAVDSFKAKIRAAAAANDKEPEQVWQWWLDYSDACALYDQSGVWSEFLDWYKDKLNA